MNNPHDISQIRMLGQQSRIGKALLEAYQDATKEKYGYILLNFHLSASSDHRILAKIYPGEDTVCYGIL